MEHSSDNHSSGDPSAKSSECTSSINTLSKEIESKDISSEDHPNQFVNIDELPQVSKLDLGGDDEGDTSSSNELSADFKAIKECVMSALTECTSSATNLVASPTEGSFFGVEHKNRTTSLWDFYKVNSAEPEMQDLRHLCREKQEHLLLKELLYFLTGIRCNNIIPKTPDDEIQKNFQLQEFVINEKMDVVVYQLAVKIVPLAAYFVGVQRIIDLLDDQGKVINALNGALSEVTRQYYLLLATIERELINKGLTMQKMLYYLRPTISVMQILWEAMVEMAKNKIKGNAVLTFLSKQISLTEGNAEAQKMLISLISKAALPYMRMLQFWIQKGVIVDNYKEFMIVDNLNDMADDLSAQYSADYWEKRYTVNSKLIPVFLEAFVDKILRTGKYLNVIRQCGKRVIPSQTMDLYYDPNSEQHAFVINNAYHFASCLLLDVLLTENDLIGHLQSVKLYFMFSQGDFIMKFMDTCEDELSKNVDYVIPTRLENLLGLAVRVSSASTDPYKDDLHCELLTYDLITQISKIMDKTNNRGRQDEHLELSGIECFAFTYAVKWPVSLVLNHIAISKYQMLFRQLFMCKHVERQLCKIWKENAITKKCSPQDAAQYRSPFMLRQRMMNAIQNIEYYMLIEIIDPNWQNFIGKMKHVENIDRVFALHNDFLDTCLQDCMLTESVNLHRDIFKLCKVSLKFCQFMQCDSTLNNTESFMLDVENFDLQFTELLISFLKRISNLVRENTTSPLLNLVNRINFNSFYTDQINELNAEENRDLLPANEKGRQKSE